MVSKIKTIILAFSGIIVYFALQQGLGLFIDEFVYVNLIACLCTILFVGFYMEIVIAYPKEWNSPPKKFITTSLLTVCVFAIASAFTSDLFLTFIYDEAFITATMAAKSLSTGLAVLSAVVNFFVAPLMEELVFRGLLYRQLSSFNKTFALIASSVVFALCHGTIVHWYTGLVGGLILGCIYQKTNKIRYSFLFHSLFNIATTVVSAFSYPDWLTSIAAVCVMNVVCGICIATLFRTEGTKSFQTGDVKKK